MHLVANDILIPHFADLLREGKRIEFTPTGVSMRPFIEGGRDVVVLQKQPDVRVGDVCLVQLPETTFVLHRVIALDRNRITLMGDGNCSGMEHCSREDVLGTVISVRSPRGIHKPLTRGWCWRYLFLPRWFWLKVYRHTLLKLYVKP
ncbi:MAG: S24/S26 family peptidase [Paludibacteraceae bacterium]|nr:S24/S26 family peptidase [Paludibacteraceae bacterium]